MFKRLFKQTDIPPEYRNNFHHLYFDLAWYNVILNAAILIGSLVGPIIGGTLGPSQALLVIALLRFLSGLSILKWG